MSAHKGFYEGQHAPDEFEVLVGEKTSLPKRYALRTETFTKRSGLLTRRLSAAPQLPVILEDVKTEVFEVYESLVHWTAENVKTWAIDFELFRQPDVDKETAADGVLTNLVNLYLLAKYLEDTKTANLTINEIVRFTSIADMIPSDAAVSLAVASTGEKDPLRLLLRDYWVFETAMKGGARLRAAIRSDTFVQEVALGLLDHYKPDPEGPAFNGLVERNRSDDFCFYHQHDDDHPRCDPAYPYDPPMTASEQAAYEATAPHLQQP